MATSVRRNVFVVYVLACFRTKARRNHRYALAALLQNRPLQTDSFWSSGNGGRLLHSGNMKATTTELRGQIERFKVPNMKEINYVRFSNGSHLGSAVLDFLNFPEPWKISKNDQRVIKTNKRIRKSY